MDRLTLTRIVVASLGLALALVPLLLPRWSRRLLTAFFGAPASPVNLALFRVVLFWTLLHSYSTSTLTWFTQLSADLRVPPYGLEWVFPYLPMTKTPAIVASQLLGAFSFMAMIGLFTRTSALLAMVLALYVLGILEFYGKVNHGNHHLIWLAAILAASRCGDALSCDAAIAAWRRANRGVIDPPRPFYTLRLAAPLCVAPHGRYLFLSGVLEAVDSRDRLGAQRQPHTLPPRVPDRSSRREVCYC